MKTVTFHCDICGKEFPPQEYSFFNGQIIKMDDKLKSHMIPFEGHYCGEDTHKLLEQIAKMKNEK